MFDKNAEITIDKLRRILNTYEPYKYRILEEIPAKVFFPDKTYYCPPEKEKYSEKQCNDVIWGEQNGGYAWFSAEYIVPECYDGSELWLVSKSGETESLLYVNKKPVGLFDFTTDVTSFRDRLHRIQPLTMCAVKGEKLEIALETYGGRTLRGCAPLEGDVVGDQYPINRKRKFEGIYLARPDKTVNNFLLHLKNALQVFDCLPKSDSLKWQAYRALMDVYSVMPEIPGETVEEVWQESIKKSLSILEKIFVKNIDDNRKIQYGLIGHSHLDTAWRWETDETVHKAARTFSNALSMMDRYDEYKFIQSSVLYIDWMKKYYPDIYKGIVKRTSEGRWEPNGGSWVECDGNMTGGEYMIRQFVRGQRFLKKNLNCRADCFWQPDTFGYSPAIPQIMLGCGLKYFLTTKLSWNENNAFPHDTFIWRGIDGSEVLTHFNLIHCFPDVETVMNAPIKNHDACEYKLISYGFGDGGGGPSAEMIENARLINDVSGLPKSGHTTVSQFMKQIEEDCNNLPVYDGELYLELHRGTLTQMHNIKRSNRMAEIAIHNLELVSVHNNAANNTEFYKDTAQMIDTLLLNQFHDILPGTALAEVHDRAISQNYEIVKRCGELLYDITCNSRSSTKSFYNPLSFQRNDRIVCDGNISFKDCVCQNYTDFDGKEKTAVKYEMESMCAVDLEIGKSTTEPSVFKFSENELETPLYKIQFTDNGEIGKLFDKRCSRELTVKDDAPLNCLLFGEDVPLGWDNWNIDYDQRMKMTRNVQLIKREVVSDGALEFRIRQKYSFGKLSSLIQDMVFYADSPRIDFESRVDWKEKHSLLKAVFPVNIRAQFARHETQFGFVVRANNENTSIERSKFEVCNHKWTDMSENRYGAAILNDCKYGISVDGNRMSLTLHKGGCSPDPRGDIGVHDFTYSLLPHISGFSAESVIREAYQLNYKPVPINQASDLSKSLFKVDAPNIIIETVKSAEDGDGYVIRLYECECSATTVNIKPGFTFRNVTETNMLEEPLNSLDFKNDVISLNVKPFEIKTIKFTTF